MSGVAVGDVGGVLQGAFEDQAGLELVRVGLLDNHQTVLAEFRIEFLRECHQLFIGSRRDKRKLELKPILIPPQKLHPLQHDLLQIPNIIHHHMIHLQYFKLTIRRVQSTEHIPDSLAGNHRLQDYTVQVILDLVLERL